MATITTLSNPLGPVGTLPRHMDNTKNASVIWKEIDLAAAATAKGSALAASDIIETLRVPAGSVLLGGWAQKTAALTGTVSVLTVSVGVTGVNATAYANAWDAFAASVGGYSTPGATTPTIISTTGGDTVDILLASLTGTLTGGKILVAVLVADTTTDSRGVIAQPKS
jgi:hypothetical protein